MRIDQFIPTSLTLTLALVLAANVAHAELSGAQRSKLRSGTTTLDQLDKRLAEVKERQLSADRVEAKLTECDARLKKAREIVAALPAAEASVTDLVARITTAEKAVAAARGGFETAQRKVEAEQGAFAAAVGDGKALDAMANVFEDLVGLNHEGGVNPERLAPWSRAKADFEKLANEIGGSLKVAQRSSPTAAARFLRAKEAYERVETERKALAASAPERVAAAIAEAKKAAADLAGDLPNYSLYQGRIDRALARGERIAGANDAVCKDLPGFTPGLPAKLTTARTEVDADLAKHRDAIIQNNRPVDNAYAGPDRGALDALVRAAWKEQSKGETLLALRFPEGWARATGHRWNASRSAWEHYDHSSIPVAVYVVGKNPLHAVRRGVIVTKWHLESDRTSATASMFRADPPPSLIVLAAKLK